jgi:hypothetical protein
MSDEQIRQAMKQAHADESAPPFAALLTGRRQARVRPAWLAVATGAVALGLALFLRPAQPQPVASERGLPSWTAPTDFLLETPGASILRTVPSLAVDVPDYTKGVLP